MKTPILGGQATSISLSAVDNRLVNLYLEMVSQGGREPAFLTRCPGLRKVVEIGTGPIRGMMRLRNFAYIVSGTVLYQVDTDYEAHAKGTVEGTGKVSMAHNGLQIAIAANPKMYMFNTFSDNFSEVTDADFPGAVTVDYIDGYFVFNEPDTEKLWATNLYDGLAVEPLDYASAEGNPDRVVCVKVSHRECWVFGADSIEVYYNAGAMDFPLARISGAYIEIGCAAPLSVAKLDNSMIWLGSDERGSAVVYKTSGYSVIRISDHSVESIIQKFSVIEDAVAYSYQQGGHAFYVLSFPTEERTFVFDVATELWHERAGFANGRFTRHRSSCQMVFNNITHVGDFEDGKVYIFDDELYSDNSATQKWLRSWRAIPTGENDGKFVIHHTLEIFGEMGVGTADGVGEDAQVILRWSDDGGRTWSNPHIGSFGRLGNGEHRAIWHNLGRSRDRIYELSGTDPNKIVIFRAELRATKCAS